MGVKSRLALRRREAAAVVVVVDALTLVVLVSIVVIVVDAVLAAAAVSLAVDALTGAFCAVHVASAGRFLKRLDRRGGYGRSGTASASSSEVSRLFSFSL